MNKILKPSLLRDIISRLNELLQEYATNFKEIAQTTRQQKDTVNTTYNSSLLKHDKKTELALEQLKEGFLQKKQSIERENQEQINDITQSLDEQRSHTRLFYEEQSETARRHSRETILEKRKAHDEEITCLQNESQSLMELLDGSRQNCSLYTQAIKKLSTIESPDDLIFELLNNEKEEDHNTILNEYDTSRDLDKVQELTQKSQETFTQLTNSLITRVLVRIAPIYLYLLLAALVIICYTLGQQLAIPSLSLKNCSFLAAISFSSLTLIYLSHKFISGKKINELALYTRELCSLCELCEKCEQAALNFKSLRLNEQLKDYSLQEEAKLAEQITKIDKKKLSELNELKGEIQDVLNEHKTNAAEQLDDIAKGQSHTLEQIEQEDQQARELLTNNCEEELSEIAKTEQESLQKINSSWQEKWLKELNSFDQINTISKEYEQSLFPSWEQASKNWQAPKEFSGAIPFGKLHLDLKKELTIPEDNCLDFNDAVPFTIPALLELPLHGSLCIKSKDEEGRKAGLQLLQNTVLRILMTLPPGKARFNFIDPLSLGETFAGFMHLNDFKEDLTGGRIATNTRQIEKQLLDLNEHMETVIQKYLRNEFKDICEYNATVGEISEPFRFLVIADFPVNFSEEAVKRLISIAKSGARCGVYILLHRVEKHHIPGEFNAEDIEENALKIDYLFGDLDWKNCGFKLASFNIESLPKAQVMNEIIRTVGTASIDATRVEIPFQKIRSPKVWEEESTEELSVAIGLTGAKQQSLSFGHGTSQHCLIAGKTGSGKSNLMHIIICNMALKYSPEELEFYLIDFKKGVEFKAYAAHMLPHAKAIAIESDREFGLSVLRKIDKDLQARGELLRNSGAQNIAQYKKASGLNLSRILLVIDEFQEIFVEDDMIAQEASLLLDRIVRQGRAFGMHVILASQTLAGSYSLPRATMGQMTIRIALQCSESDSYVILNESNNAARLLNRPGEAIYNNQAGLPEGNTPFQAAFLSDDDKDDLLQKISQMGSPRRPYIFEGNIPANIQHSQTLQNLTVTDKHQLQLVLGEPNAIQDSQSVYLENMPGQNILIVGQKEEVALSTFTSAILSASKQKNNEELEIVIFDGSSSDYSRDAYLQELKQLIPQKITIAQPANTDAIIKEIYSKNSQEKRDTTLLFFLGLQKFRKLKTEDSFSWDDNAEKSPGSMLAELISDGPSHKIHTICWLDSWSSFNRMLPRKALNDFVHRILFQMSQTDSISLTDNSEASKLGLHTAILFDDQSGEAIKYRPFTLPQVKSLSAI
jgi:DNA segregation ATPase FtsK/SpoIIIE, S-DNA-T family